MRTTTSTELRANLAASMDKVADDHEPLLVTRAGGENVVMISEEDWAGMEETLYLLQSPRNAAALLEAIAELDAGKGVERDLIYE